MKLARKTLFFVASFANIFKWTNAQDCTGQPDGTPCDVDNEECTLDTCVSDVCTAGEILTIPSVDTTYAVGSGTVDANPDGNTYIDLTFGFPANEPGLTLVNYQALVYDTPDCETGTIVGDSNGGSLFTVTIDETTKSAPKVNIVADYNDFAAPFWDQTDACNDLVGSDDNPTTDQCGVLKICVQLKSFLCGALVDFKDVNIEAEYDITTECEGDFCADVELKKETPTDLQTDVDAGFPLACYDCATGILGSGGTPAQYTQGEPVEACIALNPDVDGVCVLDIIDLDLVVGSPSVTYGIFPQGLLPGDLFLTDADPNPNYSPSFDNDAATVEFFPPADAILALSLGQTVEAKFEGVVVLGIGDTVCADLRRRYLEGEELTEKTITVKTEGEAFTVQPNAAVEPPTDDPEECTSFFLICLFMTFVSSILALFGL